MIEHEIIRAAARAAGLNILRFEGDQTRASGYAYLAEPEPYTGSRTWSPWWDLGDATALALRLGIMIIPYPYRIEAFHAGAECKEQIGVGADPDDRRFAMCMAVVHVAAELDRLTHG